MRDKLILLTFNLWLLTIWLALAANFTWAAPNAQRAFPGAVGWGGQTVGGRGGQIIKVSNLDANGPGSLHAALAVKGPKIIVFEVSGVIDLARQSLRITEPYTTIAGQTAPSPGITLIRGGIDIISHDIIIRHIRLRPGEAGQAKGSGWGEDGISTFAAWNVIVDHCSLTWATDENLSASGPRFNGKSPQEWRQATSHNITFSHNIIAEGLAQATHAKFEHSKGSLIHDNISNILIYGNLYAHNFERNPHFKGGVHGLVVNNFIYDPGQRGIHYNLMTLEWGDVPYLNGKLTAVGNVMRAGPSTVSPIAFIMLGGHGDLELYAKDNIAVDRIGQPLPQLGYYGTGMAKFITREQPPVWWPDLPVLPAQQVEKWILENVGARPWDRDLNDLRVITNAAEGRGKIIDSENEVGGYPQQEINHRPFDPKEWHLDTMEPKTPEVLDRPSRKLGT